MKVKEFDRPIAHGLALRPPCEVSGGKVAYGMKGAAKVAAKRIGKKHGRKLRAYKCSCGQWHLATKRVGTLTRTGIKYQKKDAVAERIERVVTRDEFEAFLAAYPRPLERHLVTVAEPELLTWNDFDGAVEHQDAVVCTERLNAEYRRAWIECGFAAPEGVPEDNEYRIVEWS